MAATHDNKDGTDGTRLTKHLASNKVQYQVSNMSKNSLGVMFIYMNNIYFDVESSSTTEVSNCNPQGPSTALCPAHPAVYLDQVCVLVFR